MQERKPKRVGQRHAEVIIQSGPTRMLSLQVFNTEWENGQKLLGYKYTKSARGRDSGGHTSNRVILYIKTTKVGLAI